MKEVQWLYCGAFKPHRLWQNELLIVKCNVKKLIGMSRYLSAPLFLLNWFDWLTIQDSILTTMSSSSHETERGTWEPNCLFTQWASNQTGVWPADLTPRQIHRVKQPRRIKLSSVRFEFLSGTFFHRQQLFKKLKRSHLGISEVAFCDCVRDKARIAQLGKWT